MMYKPTENGWELTGLECPLHKKKHIITISDADKQYAEERYDAPIQERFPNLPADQREILLTGMCKAAFDASYGKKKQNRATTSGS